MTHPISAMNRAIIDYYRCPEKLADSQPAGSVLQDPGYFCFGPETICYVRLSSGSPTQQVIGPLHDVSADVTAGGGIVRLPLDPDEIIENLRHERYRNNNHASPMVRNAYYWLRPFLPLPVRKHLQRARLSNWNKIAFPRWPVDRTVERLLERFLALSMTAQGIQRVPFVWFWPGGATSCAIMTHDVETLAGRDFSSQLMDLDDSAGIKSSFQIVPEGRYQVPEGFLEQIRHRGFEINIHDLNHDGLLFSSRGEFQRRSARINNYGVKYRALGFRSGGLYRNPAWYAALQFSYDMSLPSVAHLDPQRGGCCSLMPFFIGKILELPVTTTQDYSLFHILKQYSIDHWKRQISQIMEKHGLASFIIHPDYVLESRTRDTYKSLLTYLVDLRSKGKIWVALPREVNQWWRARRQMKLARQGNNWVIEGLDKDKARVAYAFLDGGRLVYELV